MSDGAYYVKVRGQIDGPYDLDQLSKLVERGRLARFHKVSTDRVSWTSVGSLTALFPPPGSMATMRDCDPLTPGEPP